MLNVTQKYKLLHNITYAKDGNIIMLKKSINEQRA